MFVPSLKDVVQPDNQEYQKEYDKPPEQAASAPTRAIRICIWLVHGRFSHLDMLLEKGSLNIYGAPRRRQPASPAYVGDGSQRKYMGQRTKWQPWPRSGHRSQRVQAGHSARRLRQGP